MRQVWETHSPEETFELGKTLSEKAQPGQIFCLEGDLGTGKTVFTKGFGAGLGIRGPINSPTFTLVQVYEDGRLPLYHFDVYRLGEPEEIEELGYEEYFFGEGVTLVEWASQVEDYIPRDAVWIRIEKDPSKGFDYRRICMETPGGQIM